MMVTHVQLFLRSRGCVEEVQDKQTDRQIERKEDFFKAHSEMPGVLYTIKMSLYSNVTDSISVVLGPG